MYLSHYLWMIYFSCDYHLSWHINIIKNWTKLYKALCAMCILGIDWLINHGRDGMKLTLFINWSPVKTLGWERTHITISPPSPLRPHLTYLSGMMCIRSLHMSDNLPSLGITVVTGKVSSMRTPPAITNVKLYPTSCNIINTTQLIIVLTC